MLNAFYQLHSVPKKFNLVLLNVPYYLESISTFFETTEIFIVLFCMYLVM